MDISHKVVPRYEPSLVDGKPLLIAVQGEVKCTGCFAVYFSGDTEHEVEYAGQVVVAVLKRLIEDKRISVLYPAPIRDS